MICDAAPSRGILWQHQHGPHDRRHEPELLPDDRWRQSDLGIESPVGRLDRRDLRLDLADKRYLKVGPQTYDVDRAALAEFGVGQFGDHIPTGSLQSCNDRLDEPGVPLIQESVEGPASPEDIELTPGIECRQDRPKRSDWMRFDMTPLQVGDRRLRHMGNHGKVDLSQPPPPAQRPHHAADALIVHEGQDRKRRSSATSPRGHPDFAARAPRLRRDFAANAPRVHPDFAATSPRVHPDFTWTLPPQAGDIAATGAERCRLTRDAD